MASLVVLVFAGVELANGFGELTDAGEQRRRFQAEMAEKARVYGESYPLDEDFLAGGGKVPDGFVISIDSEPMEITTRFSKFRLTPRCYTDRPDALFLTSETDI